MASAGLYRWQYYPLKSKTWRGVMKQKKNRKLLWIILGIALTIFLSLGAIGGIKYMNYQKEQEAKIAREHKLYKRGFRLLEEQIAIYTKEHYEGVSKIGFSPIFEEGGDGYSMYTLDIVPVIYDNHGNRAILGGKIGRVSYKSYGLGGELTLDFDGGDDSEIIELKKLDTNEVVNVSKAQHLPEKAKVNTYSAFDENVEALINDGQLREVKKSSKGSPNAKVVYNTEIRKGDYQQWR